MYTHERVCMRTCVCMDVHMYIVIYICTYIDRYVYIYIYIDRQPTEGTSPRGLCMGRVSTTRMPSCAPGTRPGTHMCKINSSLKCRPWGHPLRVHAMDRMGSGGVYPWVMTVTPRKKTLHISVDPRNRPRVMVVIRMVIGVVIRVSILVCTYVYTYVVSCVFAVGVVWPQPLSSCGCDPCHDSCCGKRDHMTVMELVGALHLMGLEPI